MDDIEIVKKIALDAGQIIMKYYGEEYDIKYKADHNSSPCTIADEDANAFIINELKRNFPEDAILAEESADDLSRLQRSRLWIVDPLDGTNDFIAKTGDFSVMIGLAIDGKSVLGVVFAPAKDELYWAVKGKGAFLQHGGETRQIHVREAESDKLILVTRNTKDLRKEDVLVTELGISNIVPAGSIGVKLGLIATGRADLHINTNFLASQWDTCAPEIILEEAGGIMTDLKGDALVYNKKELAHIFGFFSASNIKLHKTIFEKIDRIVKKHKLF